MPKTNISNPNATVAVDRLTLLAADARDAEAGSAAGMCTAFSCCVFPFAAGDE